VKAAVYEGIERIVLREVPVPELTENEILIKIKCCAICGTDLRIYHHGNPTVVPPTITGHELSGVITKTGKNVKNFKEGERVTIATSIPCLECPACRKRQYNICDNLKGIGYQYQGGFAEYMKVPEQALKADYLLKLPEGVSFEEASLSEPFACVINGQGLSGVKKGDIVLIIGAGPIGAMHVALAKINGATKVILADLIPERLDLAKQLPVDYLINTSQKELKEEVMKITEGQGADVVIVAVPSSKAQEEGLAVTAKRGRLNLFGGLPKTNPTTAFNTNLIHYREIFVHGSYGSVADQQRKALQLFAEKRIDAKKFISLTLPIEKIIEGYHISEEKRVYRVVITL